MERHNILYLTGAELAELGVFDMAEALEAVRNAFILVEKKDALLPHKIAMEWPEEAYGAQNRINVMPAFLGGDIQLAGVKWIGSSLNNLQRGLPRASAIMILNDPDTKYPVCILDGTDISAMRTGASGGIGIQYLSKKDAKTLLLLGCGVQGRTQLQAACLVRQLEHIYVNDVLHEKAKRFAEEMTDELGVPCTAITNPEAVCRTVDILISATIADKPVVHASWIGPGCTYVHMGGPECTFHTIRKADKVVTDDWECMISRGGSSPALMYDAGLLKTEDIYSSLGGIMVGNKPGRENDEEFIFYGSCGMGATDLAIAANMYKKALAQGAGTFLPYR